MLNKNNANNSGFTLIELLIAMTITAIVSAAVFSSYRSQQDAQLAQKQVADMQQNLRAALYIMKSEIRMAGYDPAGDNGAGIINAGDGSDYSNRLTFSYFNADAAGDGTNNDNDGATADADETLQAIEYYLYDSSTDTDTAKDDLGRRSGATLNAIAGNIQSLKFTYFDVNGNTTTDLSEIRSVQMEITAIPESQPSDIVIRSRTLTTIVKCRNLGL